MKEGNEDGVSGESRKRGQLSDLGEDGRSTTQSNGVIEET